MCVNFHGNLIFLLGKINKIKSYYDLRITRFKQKLAFNTKYFVYLFTNISELESNLAKKTITTNFFLYFGIFLFIYFICNFLRSCYLIFHIQKFSTHCKEQYKKRIMTIG